VASDPRGIIMINERRSFILAIIFTLYSSVRYIIFPTSAVTICNLHLL
jgi:hypothetical protein